MRCVERTGHNSIGGSNKHMVEKCEKYQLGSLQSEDVKDIFDQICNVHIEASEVDCTVTIILYSGYMYENKFQSRLQAFRWISVLTREMDDHIVNT